MPKPKLYPVKRSCGHVEFYLLLPDHGASLLQSVVCDACRERIGHARIAEKPLRRRKTQ